MRFLSAVAFNLIVCSAVSAAHSSWRSLFNGSDLSGWRIVGPPNLAPVEVRDGAMVLRQRRQTAEHTFVTTMESFKDFILEVDLKDDPGFNTGILLRCTTAPTEAKVRLNGYQVKIDPSPRAWTGGIFDDFGGNWVWLHDLQSDARARGAFHLGEWSHFRVECIGHATKVWVNGIPTSHLEDERYRAGPVAFKIHSIGDNPNAGANALRIRSVRILTDPSPTDLLPMDLPVRRADPAAAPSDGKVRR